MKAAPLLLLLAACGTPAAAPRAAEPAPVVIDPWKALDPHGRDWEAKVATIPEAQRKPMALALLREGGFDCPLVPLEDGCERRLVRASLHPSDDLDSPCLRRELALWSFDQLEEDYEVDRVLTVALDLIQEGEIAPFEKVMSLGVAMFQVDVILAMESSGNEAVADAAAATMSSAHARDLACLGVDGAVDAFSDPADVLQGEPCQLHLLRRETQLRVVRGLVARDPESSLYLALRVETDQDCVVANVIEPAPTKRRGIWPLDTCLAILRDEEVRTLVSPDGLTVKHDTDHVNDDTKDRRYREVVRNDDGFTMPFAEELVDALPGCAAGKACKVPGTTITFRFGYDAKGRLQTLEREEILGGCQ